MNIKIVFMTDYYSFIFTGDLLKYMDNKFNILIADLYKENRYKLYIHAYNLINDEESAKDIVNDVFCSILENDNLKKSSVDILPLLFVMVKNKCIDFLRHKNVVSKNKEIYIEELYSSWTAKEYAEYENKIVRMQESIRNMPPQMRHIVEEFFLKERKCSDISEELNISNNTVRTHIARALKILRKTINIFF